jgi:DnaJ-class molecular chaperone
MKCLHCQHPLRGQAWVCDDDVVVHQHCQQPFENARAGRNHQCPQCYGVGKVNNRDRPIYGSVPNPYCYGPGDPLTVSQIVDYEKMKCPLCGGHGALAKEPKPITQVVGWQV